MSHITVWQEPAVPCEAYHLPSVEKEKQTDRYRIDSNKGFFTLNLKKNISFFPLFISSTILSDKTIERRHVSSPYTKKCEFFCLALDIYEEVEWVFKGNSTVTNLLELTSFVFKSFIEETNRHTIGSDFSKAIDSNDYILLLRSAFL